jgi:hypothetical protein
MDPGGSPAPRPPRRECSSATCWGGEPRQRAPFSASSTASRTTPLTDGSPQGSSTFWPKPPRSPVAGEADPADLGRVPVEHLHGGRGQDGLDPVLAAVLVVVIAQHGQDGSGGPASSRASTCALRAGRNRRGLASSGRRPARPPARTAAGWPAARALSRSATAAAQRGSGSVTTSSPAPPLPPARPSSELHSSAVMWMWGSTTRASLNPHSRTSVRYWRRETTGPRQILSRGGGVTASRRRRSPSSSTTRRGTASRSEGCT